MRQWEENKVMKLFGRNFSLICHEGKHDDEHAYEEDHRISWNGSILQIKRNGTYRKYKESAHMA